MAQGTGVSTYGGVLAACLPLVGMRADVLRATPVVGRAARWAAAAWPGSAQAVPADGGHAAMDVFRIAQVHFDLWRRVRPVRAVAPPDVMHWTYPLPLRLVGRPNVYTVHDLIPLLHQELTGINGARMRRMLQAILRHAAHVVTVSEATREEIIAQLGVAPGHVTNTGQAVDVTGADTAPPQGLTPGTYWLHVGAVERRKNIRRLVAAWRASGTAHALVLAGPDGWNAVEQLAGAPPVRRIPWLPRPELLALIRGARGLLMPSLAEGFGLPVAEAMALGTPVLTSNRGALAEVAGGAAVLIDPEDTGAIVQGLMALDHDADLRGRLAALGLIEARRFGRDAYAGRMRAMYASVVGG